MTASREGGHAREGVQGVQGVQNGFRSDRRPLSLYPLYLLYPTSGTCPSLFIPGPFHASPTESGAKVGGVDT